MRSFFLLFESVLLSSTQRESPKDHDPYQIKNLYSLCIYEGLNGVRDWKKKDSRKFYIVDFAFGKLQELEFVCYMELGVLISHFYYLVDGLQTWWLKTKMTFIEAENIKR